MPTTSCGVAFSIPGRIFLKHSAPSPSLFINLKSSVYMLT